MKVSTRVVRRLVRAALVCLVAGLLVAAAAPAFGRAPVAGNSGGDPYSPANNHPYRHGVEPTVERNRQMQSWQTQHQPTATSAKTLYYQGGNALSVLSGKPRVYLVFWGNQWGTQSTDRDGNLTFSADPDQAAPYVQRTLAGLGTGNERWSATMTQYCDGPAVTLGASSCPSGAQFIGYPSGGALAGVWYDDSAPAPAAAAWPDFMTEATAAAQHFGNTTAASNRYAQYVVFSPHGLDPDHFLDGAGYCAWHGVEVAPANNIITLTNLPYLTDLGASCGEGAVNNPGTLDGYSIAVGHEYAETLTDPWPGAGWTGTAPTGVIGPEIADECAWLHSGQGAMADVTMGNGTYAMQSNWSNDTDECDMAHPVVGAMNGDLAAAVTPDGTSHLFWRASDGNLWTAPGPAAGGPPVSATKLGFGPLGSAPTVAVDANGVIYAYWEGTDGNLWEAYGGGTTWHGPVNRGMGPLGSPPSAAVTSAGYAYVFWKGTDAALYQAYGPANGTLRGPARLGFGPLGSAPSAGVDASGATYAYWRGTDANLWEAYWNGRRWTGPHNRHMGPLGSRPSVTITANARAYVFWRGQDANLWQGRGPATNALTLQNLGYAPIASPPNAALLGNSTYVYWSGVGNDVWEAYWGGTSWLGPVDLGVQP